MGSPKTRIGGREVEFLGMNWYFVDTGEELKPGDTVAPGMQKGKFYTGGHCVQPKDK